MKSLSLPGKTVRFWNFAKPVMENQKDAEGKDVPTQVGTGDWDYKETQVDASIPENINEALESAGGSEEKLMAIIEAGIKALAEERAGALPDGTFSPAQVKAVDDAFRMMPQFASLKEVSARRPAIMRFLGSPEQAPIKAAFELTTKHLHNAQSGE